MSKIDVILTQIRDLINWWWLQETLLEDKVSWNRLCTCLDTIGDVEVAIREFQEINKENKYTYILIYGLLQWLYLQQDTVGLLNLSIRWEKIDYKKIDWEIFSKVREPRNNIIWHPASVRWTEPSFFIISRNTISNQWFEILNYLPQSWWTEFDWVLFEDIIKIQSEWIYSILLDIKNHLMNEIETHKKQFGWDKLMNHFPWLLSYQIQKLYEWIRRSDYPISGLSLKSFDDSIEKIEKGLISRYKDWYNQQHEVLKIKHIINILSNYYGWTKVLEEYDAEIYIDVLRKEFEELKPMLEEIDEEFENRKW